jgi:hypothetical protein
LGIPAQTVRVGQAVGLSRLGRLDHHDLGVWDRQDLQAGPGGLGPAA